MTFAEYQKQAVTTAVYSPGLRIAYPALGLAGEAGEVCNKVKKVFRDTDGIVLPEVRQAIKKELGDVLWYIASLAADIGLSMEDIATDNLAMLADRKERGVIHGSGDNR
jgi:NTP pyrophosphatase (non-canonical NTP hydrolase)